MLWGFSSTEVSGKTSEFNQPGFHPLLDDLENKCSYYK